MGKYQKESTILAIVLIVLEVVILFMYGFFVRVANPGTAEGVNNLFPWAQDVNVMILIGFGYLMTFINHYGWSALGYTFLMAGVGIQYYILWEGFWKMVFGHHAAGHHIEVSLTLVIQAFFSVGSCLISTGAVLGKTHPLDLILMMVVEMIPYTLVEMLIFEVLHLQDAGGSMNIHLFGAYFGLAVSTVLGRRHSYGENLPVVTPMSGMFAMIGAIFLWMFWPSFNSAIVDPAFPYERQLAIVNTFFSMASSVVGTFAASILLRGKFGIDEVLNASLAGGVMIGSSCNLITNPAGAIAVGFFAGSISTFGFIKLSALLTKVGIYDTCGVHNLHGLPGVLGGIFSAIFLAAYTSGTENIAGPVSWNTGDWYRKGAMQLAGVALSLGISIASGIVTGLILLLVYRMEESDFFNDAHLWEIEDEHHHGVSPDSVPNAGTKPSGPEIPFYNQPMKIDTFESNVQLGQNL